MVKIVTQKFDEGDWQSDPQMFIGEVRRQELVTERDVPGQRVTSITFLNGARNRWHRHSTEQVLIVTDGIGIIADASGQYQITPGDIVVVQPDERHWHGAAPACTMTHLAILLPGTLTVDDDQS